MSYPFYQNQNYQPNYQAMYQQPVYQPTMAQNQPVRNSDERIWVQGEAGANAYLVAPNSFVRLWDSTQQVFYEKRADGSGRPITEIFTYTKKSEQHPAVSIPDDDITNRLRTIEDRISNLERMREESRNVQKSNTKSILDDTEVQ